METITEFKKIFLVDLFLLMGGHTALAGFAHAKAFFSLGQHHRGAALVLRSRQIRRIDLAHVMSATL